MIEFGSSSVFIPLAFLIGMLVGLVLRGAGNRRKMEELITRVTHLTGQLEHKPEVENEKPAELSRPSRFTASEIIQILTGVAALLAVLNAGNWIEKAITDQPCESELETQSRQINDLLGEQIGSFTRLTPVGLPSRTRGDLILDDIRYSIDCELPAQKLPRMRYKALKPARVDCIRGVISLRVDQPSSMILRPMKIE